MSELSPLLDRLARTALAYSRAKQAINGPVGGPEWDSRAKAMETARKEHDLAVEEYRLAYEQESAA